jgi:hypothetical protein
MKGMLGIDRLIVARCGAWKMPRLIGFDDARNVAFVKV